MTNDTPEMNTSNMASFEPTTLLEAIPGAIIALDRNGTVLYVNARAATIMRTKEYELPGTILWQSVPQLVVTPLYTEVDTTMRTQQSLSFVYCCPWTLITFQVHLTPRNNGVIIFFQEQMDVTVWQAMYHRQERRYRLLLEHSADSMVVLTPQGLIQDISQRLLHKARIQRGEALGTPFSMLPCWQHAPAAQRQLRAAIEQSSEGEIVSFDVQLNPNGDRENHLALTLTPQLDEHQHVEYIVCVCLDITERVQREQRKDAIRSMLNHEIRTPLTSLKLQTQMLKRKLNKQDDARIHDSLSLIETQSNTVIRLVDDILDPPNAPTDDLSCRHELVELSDVLREKVNIMQQLHDSHTIVLHDLTTHSPVMGDRDRIGQVVLNLMNNAIKYSPDAHSIEVQMAKQVETVTISVRDQGIGISQEAQEKIFERFYRAVPADRTSIPGVGIGLYIVSKIVKQHQGTISVESTPGEGSTFHVTFPLHHQ